MLQKSNLKKITNFLWEIPKSHRADMRVPARIFADGKMLDDIFSARGGQDRSLWQLVNMTTLPGVVKAVYAMPDVHEGYGACIGGVFASNTKDGIISPGSVGYDINCGVRLLNSQLNFKEIEPYLTDLANQIMRDVPSGVGRGGRFKLKGQEMDKVLNEGVKSLVKQGYGTAEDLEHIESQGSLTAADASKISDRAKSRGKDQVGTLGSGNHFMEIQKVEEVLEEKAAKVMGLQKEGIAVMIHTGSRGLGHQVCTDYVRQMVGKLGDYGIRLPDRELACAPFNSKEGQDYFGAMSAAANYAWANRQMITYLVRRAWERILSPHFDKEKLLLSTVYDVAHNIGKLETYQSQTNADDTQNNAENKKGLRGSAALVVHRKGATRAFPPGHPEIPKDYQKIGQPVLIPGSMGTASYVLVGTEKGAEAFYSSCHGAGRRMSRHEAKRKVRGSELRQQLEKEGIIIRCESNAGLAEEAPLAYKDVSEVVEVVHQAGIAKKVAKLKPLAVIKGG